MPDEPTIQQTLLQTIRDTDPPGAGLSLARRPGPVNPFPVASGETGGTFHV